MFFFYFRCPIDRTVKFLRSPTHNLRRFSVKAFKFVGSRPLVFIHCDVVVCNASDVTSACAKQCQSRGRAKRDSVYHEIHTVTRGPLIIFGYETQAQSVKTHRKEEVCISFVKFLLVISDVKRKQASIGA